jgi:hypothetical protein
MSIIGILDDTEERQVEMVRVLQVHYPALRVVVHDNAPDFLEWLRQEPGPVALLSLDHDLGPSRQRNGKRFEPGVGMDVVRLLEHRPPFCPVIVHSSNPLDAPTMVFRLEAAGWDVHRVFPSAEWIATAWLARVQVLLGQVHGPGSFGGDHET